MSNTGETKDDLRRQAAARLRSRREQLGMSVREMAQRLEVGQPRYQSWEVRFGAAPQRQFLGALAVLLVVPPEWLECGSGLAPDVVALVTAPTTPLQLPPKPLSPRERVRLGRRAQQRRIDLGLKRPDLAHAMGVTVQQLLTREKSLAASAQQEFETTWEKALRVPIGWLRDPCLAVSDSALHQA